MDIRVELLIYHGGRMKIALGSAEYRGGQVAEVDVMDDYVCFFQLSKIGTEILGYESVERMCPLAAKSGVTTLYIEVTGDPTVVADNEDAGPMNEHGYGTSDLEVEVSGIKAHQGFNHLIDDYDRTSDPKFQEAMENFGISGWRRRKVRATYQADGGVEVDQLNEAAVNGIQQAEVLIDLEDHVDTGFLNMPSMEYQSPNCDADDEVSDFEPP
ncbi:hypothetical protein LINPERHAP1_LOCUS29681, partial [Linum perenne]